jgi:intracellular septation protein
MQDFPSSARPSQPAKTRAMAPWVKFILELGPLLLFFFANSRPKLFAPLMEPLLPAKLLAGESAGLFTATGVLMVAVILALIVSYILTRRLPVMPVVTAVLVVVFGGLTFYFQDPSFIKMKPTILYACFGAALLGGLVFNRPILPIVLDNAMSLTETGWRILTLRWGLFFLVLAVLNEIVWRTQSNDHWVLFKFPGTVILIFVFTFSQVPMIMKHELSGDAAEKAPDHF